MLILTRHVGEDIVIGEEIMVRVVECNGNTVRLGVTAPREVPVDRREEWVAKRRDPRDQQKGQSGD